MRPKTLHPFFSPLTVLPGVGPKTAQQLEKLAGTRVIDLLWHFPTGIIDRSHAPSIAEARPLEIATLTVTIERHVPPPSSRHPYRIECSDESGSMVLIFFSPRRDYLKTMFPEGEIRVVSGTIQEFRNQKQMTHPDRVGTLETLNQISTVEPVYRLVAGLTNRAVCRLIKHALSHVSDLPEWLDSSTRDDQGWTSFRQSLAKIHAPEDPDDVLPAAQARARLAYDELLAHELALQIIRQRERTQPGRPIAYTGVLRDPLIARLPFHLTSSQQHAITEISGDMASDKRMFRMLQGDVGSGKTVVALVALLSAVEAGYQATLMAPTELLARQHLETARELLEGTDTRIALITGGETGTRRSQILTELADGDIDIAIGTHAMFQAGVTFRDLALCIIDEQHRFGVRQRLSLTAKGASPDVLFMTATPIPRSLMMAMYGDMAESRLTDRPPGRGPVETRALPISRSADVVDRLVSAIAQGARAFWLCPMIDAGEASDLAAAKQRHASLSGRIGDRVGLLHGQLPAAEKASVIQKFSEGTLDVLVATTVIEVGVDIPAASIMVIEHAERFGLAQLHQLRGRVGRGDQTSYCLLLYEPPLSDMARQRLRAVRDIQDGFVIAEEDLKLRGSGERMGILQSGQTRFRLADLVQHSELLEAAREEARQILRQDPQLEQPRNNPHRLLLGLFERDADVEAALKV